MPTPFAPNKNAAELGIDITRTFVLVGRHSVWPIGSKLELKNDDGSHNPSFIPKGGGDYEFVHWHKLAYADDSIQQPTKSFMSTVITTLKNLTLSKEDKILRENGFENECGKPTEDTRKAMLEELADAQWATKRAQVANQLLEEKE